MFEALAMIVAHEVEPGRASGKSGSALAKGEPEHWYFDFPYLYRAEETDIRLQAEEVDDHAWCSPANLPSARLPAKVPPAPGRALRTPHTNTVSRCLGDGRLSCVYFVCCGYFNWRRDLFPT